VGSMLGDEVTRVAPLQQAFGASTLAYKATLVSVQERLHRHSLAAVQQAFSASILAEKATLVESAPLVAAVVVVVPVAVARSKHVVASIASTANLPALASVESTPS